MGIKLITYSKIAFLILLIVESSFTRIDADAIFQEDFEFTSIPLYYQLETRPQCYVSLTNEKYYSGQQSLHLQTVTEQFGCHLEIPLGIPIVPDLSLSIFQYFEVSIPFYEIYVSGKVNGIEHEIILEYGNPDRDWVGNKFLVRGLDDIPQLTWDQLETSMVEDLQLAFNHTHRPYGSFEPYILNKLRLALDPADPDSQRSIYIDLIEFTSEKYIESSLTSDDEITTTGNNFKKVFTWILVVPTSIALMLIVIFLIKRSTSQKLDG